MPTHAHVPQCITGVVILLNWLFLLVTSSLHALVCIVGPAILLQFLNQIDTCVRDVDRRCISRRLAKELLKLIDSMFDRSRSLIGRYQIDPVLGILVLYCLASNDLAVNNC